GRASRRFRSPRPKGPVLSSARAAGAPPRRGGLLCARWWPGLRPPRAALQRLRLGWTPQPEDTMDLSAPSRLPPRRLDGRLDLRIGDDCAPNVPNNTADRW